MTDEKTTKQILATRLKITDKEILDATYIAYKKLTEKTLSDDEGDRVSNRIWPSAILKRKAPGPRSL